MRKTSQFNALNVQQGLVLKVNSIDITKMFMEKKHLRKEDKSTTFKKKKSHFSAFLVQLSSVLKLI